MRTYLEVTFRQGKPLAAYLFLPRLAGDRSHSTREITAGIRADFAADGRPIGLEFLNPSAISTTSVNSALASLGLPTLNHGELAPLAA